MAKHCVPCIPLDNTIHTVSLNSKKGDGRGMSLPGKRNRSLIEEVSMLDGEAFAARFLQFTSLIKFYCFGSNSLSLLKSHQPTPKCTEVYKSSTNWKYFGQFSLSSQQIVITSVSPLQFGCGMLARAVRITCHWDKCLAMDYFSSSNKMKLKLAYTVEWSL